MDDGNGDKRGPQGQFLPLQKIIDEATKREAREASTRSRARETETRAKLIAAERLVSGTSIKDIAESYGIGRASVLKALTIAERAGFYEAIEEILLSRLLPKALAVYELHLDRGNLDAARDVVYGIGALKKNPAVEVTVGNDALAEFRPTRALKQ